MPLSNALVMSSNIIDKVSSMYLVSFLAFMAIIHLKFHSLIFHRFDRSYFFHFGPCVLSLALSVVIRCVLIVIAASCLWNVEQPSST